VGLQRGQPFAGHEAFLSAVPTLPSPIRPGHRADTGIAHAGARERDERTSHQGVVRESRGAAKETRGRASLAAFPYIASS
jgi:hypothetical protein